MVAHVSRGDTVCGVYENWFCIAYVARPSRGVRVSGAEPCPGRLGRHFTCGDARENDLRRVELVHSPGSGRGVQITVAILFDLLNRP